MLNFICQESLFESSDNLLWLSPNAVLEDLETWYFNQHLYNHFNNEISKTK